MVQKTDLTRAPHIDYANLFRSLADAYIVFDVNDPEFTILEENKAHEKIALTSNAKTIGRPLLEAFPDTSESYLQRGESQLLESLRKVIRTGKADKMPNLKYDIPDQDGAFAQKYWKVTHYPIKDDAGEVTAIYQATEDITDRVNTEQQLALTKYQLAQTLANGSIGTWNWNIKAQKVYSDANLSEMYGLEPSQGAQGVSLDMFIRGIVKADRPRVIENIEKAVAERTVFEDEYRTIDKQKRQRWVIARGRVEVDEAGELDRFPGVAIDITERKESEKNLAENENRLRFMADSMPQLVWITRPDGYHEYYNQRWYQYTGMEDGSTDGRGWNELFHKDDRARAWKVWRHSLKTGEPYEIEYRLYHAPSQAYRWVIGRALPFRNSSGEITKWYGTCTDIHEQKHTTELQAFLADASKQLSSSLEFKKILRQISKTCVPAIADWCSVDLYDKAQGTFEQINVAHADPQKLSLVAKHRQLNPISADGNSGTSKVIRTGQTEFYPVVSEAMLESAISDPETFRFMKSLQLHSIIIAPIAIYDQTAGAISFITTDSKRTYTADDVRMVEELAGRISLAITNSKLYHESVAELKQRKTLEKQLIVEKQKLESRVIERTQQLQSTNKGLRDEIVKRQAVEAELHANSANLARSNQELQDFAYVASHDLQEPLRKIQAFGNLLQTEYASQLGEGADYLDRMRKAAVRMSTLIEDLLSFSRVTTKARPSVKVDLNEIFDDVMLDLESRITETGGQVKADKLPFVKTDPTHMRQLFQNLISNALKFHKSDVPPRVHIRYAATSDGYHEISVADNGIGFDPKYVDRIFSVFQRLHDRSSYEGTGIGLAVCRKIVERYGGTITAESTNNDGAVFIVRLPMKGTTPV